MIIILWFTVEDSSKIIKKLSNIRNTVLNTVRNVKVLVREKFSVQYRKRKTYKDMLVYKRPNKRFAFLSAFCVVEVNKVISVYAILTCTYM